MKICKTCNVENDDKALLCKYCGSYMKFSNSMKMLLIGFICGVIGIIFVNTILILLLFPAVVLLFIGVILYSIEQIKTHRTREKNNVDIKVLLVESFKREKENNRNETTNDTFFTKTYFLSANTYRENDDKLERGDCELYFENGAFYIKQGDELIENPINSIYSFDTWVYNGAIYFKIQMRSKNEYKFCNQHSETEGILKFIERNNLDIKIEDYRNEPVNEEIEDIEDD